MQKQNNTEKKKVLVLNGSISEIPVIEELKNLGFYVVTTGNQPTLTAHKYADEYIPEDYSNYEKILSLVKENNIYRVIACANDFGVITAAYVSEKMGWPGHDTFENALLLHQKDRFKEFFFENNIRSVRSIPFQDKEKAYEYLKTAEYPVIIKAVDLTGGKGILRAENYEEGVIAVDNAFDKSREKHIVIEPFIVGDQETYVGFVKDKKVISYVTNNAYSPINNYLIQTEILPSTHCEEVQEELKQYIELMCNKLNLVDGVFTLQYIVKDHKPYIIELMRRNLGNQYFTSAEASNGFPWFKYLVRSELGMSYDGLKIGTPIASNVIHHGIMSKNTGIIKDVVIDPSVEKHVYKKIITIHENGKISDYMNERAGWLYLKYDNREEALSDISNINSLVTIEFEK